jgi:hypothetical protein
VTRGRIGRKRVYELIEGRELIGMLHVSTLVESNGFEYRGENLQRINLRRIDLQGITLPGSAQLAEAHFLVGNMREAEDFKSY